MNKIALLLVIAAAGLSGCRSAASHDKDKDKKAAVAKKDAETTETSADVDFQSFLGRLRKAVAARDMNTLAAMMTPDFAYSLGASSEQDKKGEGVFQYWDDNGLWPELEGIMSENFVKKEEFMVAPPQFANTAVTYEGYRAGIRRVNGSWKFTYFVNN